MRWINLRGSELVHFPVQLKQLEALVFCDLGLTSLQAIPSDFTHANLETLYVDGNALTTVPATLLHFRMDQNNIMDLSHVNVSHVSVYFCWQSCLLCFRSALEPMAFEVYYFWL